MQTNINDHGKHLKDEDGVNFRPSPNFKHMKKYLKSKIEESGCPGGAECPERGSEAEGGSGAVEAHAERRGGRGAVRPPLPPHPPPPESPPRAALKTEREDDGYERAEARAEPARTMCRQFARGACTRGAACIYAHEIILDQLHGVYTFCKNFQNAAGCNLPKCKFVHATVFEKELFYRTGHMPPHALAHVAAEPAHRDGGPPPPDSEGGAAGAAAAAPALGVAAVAAAPAGGGGGAAFAPLDRDPHEPAGRDAALADASPNKCKDCDIAEFRLQVLKQKVEGVLRSNEETCKKTAQLAMKSNKLNAVIAALMKTSPPAALAGGAPAAPPAPPPAPVPLINVRNEKEINGLVDQLKLRLPPAAPRLAPPNTADDKSCGVPGALVRLLLKGMPPEHAPMDPRH